MPWLNRTDTAFPRLPLSTAQTNKIITNWNAWNFQDNRLPRTAVIIALIAFRPELYGDSFFIAQLLLFHYLSHAAPSNWIKWNWHTPNDCTAGEKRGGALRNFFSLFSTQLQVENCRAKPGARSQSLCDFYFFFNKLPFCWCQVSSECGGASWCCLYVN